MARRTPRQEATHEKTLTPLQERCEQCGQPLWVAYHGHRTVTTLSGLWKLTLVVRESYRADLSVLSSAVSTGRRRALGTAAWRIRPGSDCLDWPVAVSRPPQCAGDASGPLGPWHPHCRAQCDLVDAAL
jgi:hypothetical protein